MPKSKAAEQKALEVTEARWRERCAEQTGTAKREAAERRIEQQRQPAWNPKAGNIIACSRANGKLDERGAFHVEQ